MYQIHTFVIGICMHINTITETISISLKGSNIVADINDVNYREWKLNVIVEWCIHNSYYRTRSSSDKRLCGGWLFRGRT